jgi:hypothetical protein
MPAPVAHHNSDVRMAFRDYVSKVAYHITEAQALSGAPEMFHHIHECYSMVLQRQDLLERHQDYAKSVMTRAQKFLSKYPDMPVHTQNLLILAVYKIQQIMA